MANDQQVNIQLSTISKDLTPSFSSFLLNDEDFFKAVGQVVNLVKTYGSSFSFGLLIFQGGDSKDLQHR